MQEEEVFVDFRVCSEASLLQLQPISGALNPQLDMLPELTNQDLALRWWFKS